MARAEDKDIVICAPSYRRPEKVETLSYVPSLKVFVAKAEYGEYKGNYPQADIVAIPDRVQGNICRVRNFILDYLKGTPVVCIVDDDLKYIAYWENGESHPLALEKEIYDFIYKYSIMAMDLGVHLWGINVGQDPKFYSLDRPFSLVAYIGAPFGCHVDQDLRYDERLPLKEDYDFTLQQLNVHRRVLRVNKFYYVVRQVEQEGGCAMYRNLIAEREQFELLQKKWGKRIVKGDTLKTSRGRSEKVRKFDINPVIYPPIKGT